MINKTTLHENLAGRSDVKVGSERSFGLVSSVVFIVISLLPLFTMSDQEGQMRIWALVVAAFFAGIALTVPRLLAPLNKLWFRFGLLLHRIVNPFVMGLLFFLTVTPTGLLMRAMGKTPLQLGFDDKADTYWIPRTPPGPAPETMKRQF
ncbi:MAG: hypothetical protein H8E36_16155 [Rhodospirillaceae bacterium]|nr:hypothetical protein [Rhodospirillaceae bacterium]